MFFWVPQGLHEALISAQLKWAKWRAERVYSVQINWYPVQNPNKSCLISCVKSLLIFVCWSSESFVCVCLWEHCMCGSLCSGRASWNVCVVAYLRSFYCLFYNSLSPGSQLREILSHSLFFLPNSPDCWAVVAAVGSRGRGVDDLSTWRRSLQTTGQQDRRQHINLSVKWKD